MLKLVKKIDDLSARPQEKPKHWNGTPSTKQWGRSTKKFQKTGKCFHCGKKGPWRQLEALSAGSCKGRSTARDGKLRTQTLKQSL